MRIVAVAAAFGLVALTGFSLAPVRSASAQDGGTAPQPGFCPSLEAAMREAPTGFRDVRGYGRDVTPHPGIPERDYEHAVSTPLAGAQCIVRTRDPGRANGGVMTCMWSGPNPGLARVRAFYDAVQACLGGRGAHDLPAAAASPERPGVFEAYVERGRARIAVFGSGSGLMVMMGGPDSTVEIGRAPGPDLYRGPEGACCGRRGGEPIRPSGRALASMR